MPDTDCEQVNDLGLGQFMNVVHPQEVVHIVLLGVHGEHLVDGSRRHKEPFLIVLTRSLLYFVRRLQHNFLEVGWRVVAIGEGHRGSYFEEGGYMDLPGELVGADQLDEVEISHIKKVGRVLVSELELLQDSDNLGVDHLQLVVESLVQHDVVQLRVDAFADRAEVLQAMGVDLPQDEIEFLLFLHVDEVDLVDQCSQELDDEGVFVENAEEQAVEEHHLVVLDILRVLSH
mmetsp:Transcript_41399/g.63112  ORF Transcript_41399/g.63112 Transcript_41399/m.63112 type:complete len:231 (-) Transcript_41399:1393-2085(-)